jgi:hypothetical protein
VYSVTLPTGTLVGGGTYTLTGTGGTQVGPFTASATLPTSFTITNLDSLAAIDRTKPLTLNWTGGGFDAVNIQLGGTILGTPTHQVLVTCEVPGGPGSFTIPAAALSSLPAIAAANSNAVGQLVVSAGVGTQATVSAESNTATTLTPNLVGGGQVDFGSFSAFLGIIKAVTIQ